MKKVLAMILVVLLAMAMVVPAAANITLSGSVSNTLPALAKKEDNVKLYNREAILESSEDIQNVVIESDKELKNVDSKGLGLRYFFYTEILSDEKSISLEFEPIPHKEILFMQYIEGLWIELEHSIGDDGIITIADIKNAPLSIFVESLDSPGGMWVNLVPVLTDESYLIVQLHALDEMLALSEDVQNRLAEAKEQLKDACPDGFAVKYFFEMEIIGTDESISVDFEPIEHNEIVFKQYVAGPWAELDASVGTNGIITVSGVVNGPVATFIK